MPTYQPVSERYDHMPYRRCGRSGLQLPAISLGLWQNFGADRPFETSRAIVRRAFDLGITHIDLANNYGPPYGSAEETFGRIVEKDLRPYRDELVISSKAGYDMWPGPYGNLGSRKYLIASCDQSLARLGLEYVDIFYSHRHDPDTPLEETMGALDQLVRSGKALYAGISSYSAARTRDAVRILRELGTPLLIHQPSYSMLNRWIEDELLDTLGDEGVGCITFSPLAQGMLTDRYLDGIPEGSRASQDGSLSKDLLHDENLEKVRALAGIARRRGQSLAQLALAWTLRDPRVSSTLIGASSVAQLEDNVGALRNLDFTRDELVEIDRHATESGINLWARSSAGYVPSVRRIEPGDGVQLRDVRLRALQHDPRSFASSYAREAAFTAEDWDDWTRRHAQGTKEATFLAFADDGTIAGLAGGFQRGEDPATYTLFSMWVAPEHRRGGHGRRLVDTVADWARDAGSTALNLLVTDPRAVVLYERAGFADDGRREPLPSDPSLMEMGMTRRLGTA